jgi:hypothetical protein
MGNLKTGRNGPCPCGSGKKFKKCCQSKEQHIEHPASSASVDQQIHELGLSVLEQKEESTLNAIDNLRRLIDLPRLSRNQKRSAKLNLAIALQYRGDHHNAIDVLKFYRGQNPFQEG